MKSIPWGIYLVCGLKEEVKKKKKKKKKKKAWRGGRGFSKKNRSL
jgi:hypothetical protein